MVDLTPKDFIRVFRQWTKDRQLTRKKFNNIKSLINDIYYYAIEEGIVILNPVKDISSRNFTFKAINHSDDVFTLISMHYLRRVTPTTDTAVIMTSALS